MNCGYMLMLYSSDHPMISVLDSAKSRWEIEPEMGWDDKRVGIKFLSFSGMKCSADAEWPNNFIF